MRRKVGVSAVKGRINEMDKFNQMGKKMDDTKLSFVTDLMKTFESSLRDFAMKHRDRINKDPEFRQQFHKMCLSVGVDPLASNKGFWADMLGVGDFYFELGVKIIEISVQTRAMNGGVMNLKEMLNLLNKLNKTKPTDLKNLIVEDDIVRAVEKLRVLGNGFRMVSVGSGSTLIISVPMEINVDHEVLMTAAQQSSVDHGGMVHLDMMMTNYGWSSERFYYVINPLLQEGIVWIDQYQGVTNYYFPSLWKHIDG